LKPVAMPKASNWIDFRAVRQNVTMDAILERYGIHLRRISPEVLRGKCPLPSHSSKSPYSFIVQTKKHVWSCHSSSCSAARNGRIGGNVLDFVAAMENCSIRDAAVKIAGWLGSPALRMEMKLPASQKADGHEVEGSNPPLQITLHGIDPTHPYIFERGITAETAETFGIGFYGRDGIMRGRVVIPIHNEAGQRVAYAGRSIAEIDPKYRFPKGFRKALELFNLHRTAGSNSVIVVEGFFDAMKVHQAGYRNVVALMGSTLPAAQERKLTSYFGEVILMLDGDRPGREATAKIGRQLASKVKVSIAGVPDGAQPDQLSTAELRRLLRPEAVRPVIDLPESNVTNPPLRLPNPRLPQSKYR
jgi:DNA primase